MEDKNNKTNMSYIRGTLQNNIHTSNTKSDKQIKQQPRIKTSPT